MPPAGTVAAVVAALRARGMSPAVGGSGLLVALGLADVAHDWDVTVDADPDDVHTALTAAGRTVRDDTATTGVYATARRFVVDGDGHDVDVLVGFALRGPVGIEVLPSRVTGTWRGLPLADPVVWARAYRLLGRTAKADLLDRFLD